MNLRSTISKCKYNKIHLIPSWRLDGDYWAYDSTESTDQLINFYFLKAKSWNSDER